ncbi:MAG: N-acetylmuramoyl-L-alanine amidase [Cyanophyceae cyanobacterium]
MGTTLLKLMVTVLPGCFTLLTHSSAAWSGELEYWRFNAQLSRLEIITAEAVRPQVQLIGNPTRLVVDLPDTNLGQPPKSQMIGRFVKEVRVGQFNPQTTRMVVELGEYTMRPQEIRVRSLAPNRWFVQLPKLQPLSERLPPANGAVVIAVFPPQPHPASRTVVAIDPGHGGVDPGAIGRDGIQEKNINLPIALEVAKILKQQGMQVELTRTGDHDVSLSSRVAQAERANAALFVSIHANAISLSRPEVNGLETYYYRSGVRLAQSIHNSILRRLDVRDRGVKQARFYVLRETSMPAVLVEVGFVTGSEDSRNLVNAAYRQRMAEAITAGIVQYLQ